MSKLIDAFGNVIDAINATGELDSDVQFYYGHPVEIVATLADMVKNPAGAVDRFPAVCLMMDFEERMNEDGYYCIAEPAVVIITDTRPDYDIDTRYSESFTKVLDKIYDLLMAKLESSTEIECGRNPNHTRIDRPHWGKTGLYGNTANMFNDFIDAIEIKNLELKVLKS